MVGNARLLLLVFFLPLVSFADESCPENLLVAEKTLSWDFATGSRTDFYLPTYNSEQQRLVRTDAAAHFSSDGSAMNVLFDFNSNLIWLPYNIYRFDVEVGTPDSPDYFLKSAGDCNGFPTGMRPGEHLVAYPIKIPPRANGEPRGQEPVRIRVWGHLH
jgi:hypothetical protein